MGINKGGLNKGYRQTRVDGDGVRWMQGWLNLDGGRGVGYTKGGVYTGAGRCKWGLDGVTRWIQG